MHWAELSVKKITFEMKNKTMWIHVWFISCLGYVFFCFVSFICAATKLLYDGFLFFQPVKSTSLVYNLCTDKHQSSTEEKIWGKTDALFLRPLTIHGYRFLLDDFFFFLTTSCELIITVYKDPHSCISSSVQMSFVSEQNSELQTVLPVSAPLLTDRVPKLCNRK